MRNVITVIKHEIVSTITKPSFWLTTFVLPAVVMVFTFGSQFLSTALLEDESNPLTEPATEEEAAAAVGYVDQAALIRALPPGISEAALRAFDGEAEAQAALDEGQVQQVYVIPEDYVERGELLVIQREFAPLGNLPTVDVFEYILTYNLVGDATLATRVSTPLASVDETALEGESSVAPDDFSTRFVVGYGVLFIFFFVLTMSSSYMLRSVSREKENRTVEVLLVSLRPRELMLGKVLGLGALALVQMGIWMGGSTLVLQRGDSLLDAFGATLGSIALPEGFMVWAVVYFLLGYILYASLLGAIGALAPNARETGQFTFIAMFPLMLPLWLNTVFIQTPHGTMAKVLSLFPLTAPTAMLPRLAMGGVALWQPVVGALLLAATTYGLVLLSARFFRADTLLSSASLSWQRFVKEFKQGT